MWSQVAIRTQNSNSIFGKYDENSFQKRNPFHSCIRALLTKNFLTFTFFSISVSQTHFVAVALWTLSIALQFFFFLLNLNSTDNEWHLNSPQGSTASCQREMQYRVWRNQCARACASKSDCVCSRLKAYTCACLPMCVCVWECTRHCSCVHLCSLVCGRDLLTLTHSYYVLLNCYIALSETLSQTFASCSSDTDMMYFNSMLAEGWKREQLCYSVEAPNGSER